MWFLRAGYDCHPSWWSDDLQVNVSELKRQNSSGRVLGFFPLLTQEIFETSRCCVKRDRHDSRLRKATTASQAAWFLKIWGKFKDFTHPHFFGRSILGIARAY